MVGFRLRDEPLLDPISLSVGLGIGGLVALVVGWVFWKLGRASSKEELAWARAQAAVAERGLSEARRQFEKDQTVYDARLGEKFSALSASTLQANSEGFLLLAKGTLETALKDAELTLEARKAAVESLVGPLGKALETYQRQIEILRTETAKSIASLESSVQSMQRTSNDLMSQTGKLSGALANNQVRGAWGEISLHRVVELAGMTDHVDFREQVPIPGEERGGRPDMIIQLPSGAVVPVDAKVPLAEYLRASGESDPATFERGMEAHAQALERHVTDLARRDYPASLGRGPGFTILFVPGESFLSAALRAKPELLESAAKQHVILATPTTLLSLLQAVVVGWNEQGLAQRAEEIANLGRELHERVGKVAEHVAKLGVGLTTAVRSYNDMVGSIDRNLLTTAARLEHYSVRSSRDLPGVSTIDTLPRELPPKMGQMLPSQVQSEEPREPPPP